MKAMRSLIRGRRHFTTLPGSDLIVALGSDGMSRKWDSRAAINREAGGLPQLAIEIEMALYADAGKM